jgi:hypothetical protein
MPENVVRELAEKGAAYTKDTYAKTQAAAGETTKVMQQTYAAASKGAADLRRLTRGAATSVAVLTVKANSPGRPLSLA